MFKKFVTTDNKDRTLRLRELKIGGGGCGRKRKIKFFLKVRYAPPVTPDYHCENKQGGGRMVNAATVEIVRAYLDLTQTELAESMGVSAGSVSAVENGTNRVTHEFAKKFRRAVGISDAVLVEIQDLKL